jgi:hypothetical protein
MIPTNCRECHYPMRPAQVPIAQKPGTRQHRAHGLCKTCYYAGRRSGTIPEPVRDGTGGVESARPPRVFDERMTVSALEAWLRERRNRLAKQGATA